MLRGKLPINPEAELIRDIKRRKPEAFEYIYSKYAGALNSILISIAGLEHSDSLLQATFVKAYKTIDQYNEKNYRLFTWMMNIARDLAIKQGDISISTSQESWSTQDTAAFIAYSKGYTMSQIATVLNIPIEQVGSKIRTSIQILRQQHSYELPADKIAYTSV